MCASNKRQDKVQNWGSNLLIHIYIGNVNILCEKQVFVSRGSYLAIHHWRNVHLSKSMHIWNLLQPSPVTYLEKNKIWTVQYSLYKHIAGWCFNWFHSCCFWYILPPRWCTFLLFFFLLYSLADSFLRGIGMKNINLVVKLLPWPQKHCTVPVSHGFLAMLKFINSVDAL